MKQEIRPEGGRCPLCKKKGRIVKRDSLSGAFGGCIRYPYCKYTCQLADKQIEITNYKEETKMKSPDIVKIKEFLQLLDHEQLTWLQCLPTNRGHQVDMESSDREELVKMSEEYNKIRFLIYASLNERSFNPHSIKGKESVASLNNISIDLDWAGSKEKYTTEEEKKLVVRKARKIQEDLKERFEVNFPIIMTGNGCQLILTIERIPLTDENRLDIDAKIKFFLKNIKDKYDGDNIKVDMSVAHIAALTKVVGTISWHKGFVLKLGTAEREVIALQPLKRENSPKLREYLLNLRTTPEEPLNNWFNEETVKQVTEKKKIRIGSTESESFIRENLKEHPYKHSPKVGIVMGQILSLEGEETSTNYDGTHEERKHISLPVQWFNVRYDFETKFPRNGFLELSPKKLNDFEVAYKKQGMTNENPFFVSFSMNSKKSYWYFPNKKEFFELREKDDMTIITSIPSFLEASKESANQFLYRKKNRNWVEKLIQGILDGTVKSLRGGLKRFHLALYCFKKKEWTKDQIRDLLFSPSIRHEFNPELTEYHLDRIHRYYVT